MTIFRSIFGGRGKKKGQINPQLMRMDLNFLYGDSNEETSYRNKPENYEAAYIESPTFRNNAQQEIRNRINNGLNTDISIVGPVATPPNDIIDVQLPQQEVIQLPQQEVIQEQVQPRRFGQGRRRRLPVDNKIYDGGTLPEVTVVGKRPAKSYSRENSTQTGKPREYPFPSTGFDAFDELLLYHYDLNYKSPQELARERAEARAKAAAAAKKRAAAAKKRAEAAKTKAAIRARGSGWIFDPRAW